MINTWSCDPNSNYNDDDDEMNISLDDDESYLQEYSIGSHPPQ
jgi:hypothetical protein